MGKQLRFDIPDFSYDVARFDARPNVQQLTEYLLREACTCGNE